MQFAEAEAWCAEHSKGAKACLKALTHLDLVGRSALDVRLKKRVMTGACYASLKILTPLEETDLVRPL